MPLEHLELFAVFQTDDEIIWIDFLIGTAGVGVAAVVSGSAWPVVRNA